MESRPYLELSVHDGHEDGPDDSDWEYVCHMMVMRMRIVIGRMVFMMLCISRLGRVASVPGIISS